MSTVIYCVGCQLFMGPDDRPVMISDGEGGQVPLCTDCAEADEDA